MAAPTNNLILAGLALTLLQGACGESEAVSGVPTGDVILSDATGNEPEPDSPVAPTGTGLLQFEEEIGDDGLACEAICTVYLSYNEERTLQILYTRDGVPVIKCRWPDADHVVP